MAEFRVRVFDAHAGCARTIQVAANSADEARAQISDTGLTVLHAEQSGQWLQQRAPKPDIGLMCEELATLTRAGLNLLEALETLGAQADSAAAPLYRALAGELQQGRTLSAALAQRTDEFPPVLVASIRAAERTGRIADTLDQYSKFYRGMQELRRQLLSACIYPCVVIGFGGLIAVFLLLFVIPRFASVYSVGGPQPGFISSVLMALSHHMASYRSIWLMLLILAVVGVVIAIRTGAMKAALLRTISRIEPVQRWLQLFEMSEVFRSLAMLLRGGFNLVEALHLSREAPALPELRARLLRVAQSVEEGSALSVALKSQDVADAIAMRLVQAGERSSDLPAVLDAVADEHSRRVERRLHRVMRLAEPLIMIGVGGMVGMLVILMYMPVFDLAGALR